MRFLLGVCFGLLLGWAASTGAGMLDCSVFPCRVLPDAQPAYPYGLDPNEQYQLRQQQQLQNRLNMFLSEQATRRPC